MFEKPSFFDHPAFKKMPAVCSLRNIEFPNQPLVRVCLLELALMVSKLYDANGILQDQAMYLDSRPIGVDDLDLTDTKHKVDDLKLKCSKCGDRGSVEQPSAFGDCQVACPKCQVNG